MWFIGFHAVLFWFLFYDFFYNSYAKSKQKVVLKENIKPIEKIEKNNNDETIHKISDYILTQKLPAEAALFNRKSISADLLRNRNNEFEKRRNQY